MVSLRSVVPAVSLAVMTGLAQPLIAPPGAGAVTVVAAAPSPITGVTISGSGIDQAKPYFPAYDSSIDRFAIVTSTGLTSLDVTVATTDPSAEVRINGAVAAANTPVPVTGLTAGDEVNVQVTDAAGTSNQSWIVLPAGFPRIQASGPHADLEPGHVFLGLGSFLGSGSFEAVIDAWGVPAHVATGDGQDFKASGANPDHYSIARGGYGAAGRIDELDEQFRVVRTLKLVARPGSTDFHDSVLMPNGDAVLVGYDMASRDGADWVDAVIERQDAEGNVTFSWNSKDHVDPSESFVSRVPSDYAHINSVQVLDNGDYLASFRNLSQVMRIAGSDHDGFTEGQVIWRLGGVRNDFTIVDPLAGPCAQHAATLLPNGHLMIFDNGSRYDEQGPLGGQTADMCPDPATAGNPPSPAGAPVARPQSRVTEYAIDESATPPTATLVWSHVPTGRYAPFAGNAQRLAANTLVGWSWAEGPTGTFTEPIATEVRPDGEEIWAAKAQGWFTYRAFKHAAPDRIDPVITIDGGPDGKVVEEGTPLVAPTVRCTDRGGSNLASCTASTPSGGALPTTPGTHDFTVTARDRAGNTVTRTATYTVLPRPAATEPGTTDTATPAPAPTPRPDLTLRRGSGAWKGEGVRARKRANVTLTARRAQRFTVRVRVRNIGDAAARMRLSGGRQPAWMSIRWFAGRKDVTRRVAAGTFRTRSLRPGRAQTLRAVVVVERADRPRRMTYGLTATPGSTPTPRDVVGIRVRTR